MRVELFICIYCLAPGGRWYACSTLAANDRMGTLVYFSRTGKAPLLRYIHCAKIYLFFKYYLSIFVLVFLWFYNLKNNMLYVLEGGWLCSVFISDWAIAIVVSRCGRRPIRYLFYFWCHFSAFLNQATQSGFCKYFMSDFICLAFPRTTFVSVNSVLIKKKLYYLSFYCHFDLRYKYMGR